MSNQVVSLSSTPIQTGSLTIPPGTVLNPGIATSQIAGAVFVCIATTSPFTMKFDQGSEFTCLEGAGIPVAAGFKGFTLINTTANAITVSFLVGQLGVFYVGSNSIRERSSFAQSTYDGAMANNATLAVPGNVGGFQRKQLFVRNLDVNNNPVTILDGAGNPVYVVLGGESWTSNTDASVTLKAAGGALTRVVVGELYYYGST